MSLRDLVEGEALMDDDENDEGMDDYDGEVREGAGTVNHYNDSSDEDDEEEDDEEAQRAVSSLELLNDELCADMQSIL
jgi:transcription elongation factor SPT6